MSVEEDGGESTYQGREIDYAQLHAYLRQLVDCYNSALTYIYSLDRSIGRLSVKYVTLPVEQNRNTRVIENAIISAISTPVSKYIFIKYLVVWYLEAHIRSKLLKIIQNRRLLVDRLNVPFEENSNPKKIFFNYLDNLERYTQGFFHWGRIKAIFQRIFAFIPFALPILILVIPSLRIYKGLSLVDLWDKLASGVFSQFFPKINLNNTTVILVSIFYLLPFAVLLYLIFIEWSFKLKRAILAGGFLEVEQFGNYEIKLYIFQGMPLSNIYQIESKVFALLGTSKPKEKQIDIWANLYTIVLFHGLFSFLILFKLNIDSSSDPLPRDMICWLVILMFFGIYTVLKIRNDRKKRFRSGNV